VQGWTGINHSYAMVNQYQLLALSTIENLTLFHQEMPLFDPRWTKEANNAGFNQDEQQVLASIRGYEGQPVTAVYRIHTNNSLTSAASRVITFLVTEVGLDARSFSDGADVKAYNSAGNIVVTPSRWSRERILDFGFDHDKVFVIPHGVDKSKFFQLDSNFKLNARTALGYTQEDVVFLNVGAPIWTKGMDLVIESFFRIRKTKKNARLLIKDQQSLYGLSAVDMIKNMVASGKIEIDNDTVESIRVLPNTLDISQLRSLYNTADYYLSPYRAEGFNLPVIEAIACGTKVIVTDGGSTDDFCDEYTSIKIPSILQRNAVINGTVIGAHLQPDMDALIATLLECCEVSTKINHSLQFGKTKLVECFNWRRAANMICSLM
jgi:glycosyltransferase involved in cell wall biosynthesis